MEIDQNSGKEKQRIFQNTETAFKIKDIVLSYK
jgi:hypothetical protein